MTFLKYLSIVLIVSILSISCKTKKQLEKKKSAEMKEIYNSIINKYVNYETLLIKAATHFENQNQKLKLKATIKIKHDSLIIISLSPGLGIEVARIKFTNDSIFILDRLSSQITKGRYKFVNDTYKIDIGYMDIQSILTNELFIYPHKNKNLIAEEFVNTFNIRNNNDILDLYRKTEKLVENLISINIEKYAIRQYIINDVFNKRNLNIEYVDTYSEEFNNLPKRIYVVSSIDNKFTKIKLNYSKIVKNKNLNFSFRIPAKYKTIVY